MLNLTLEVPFWTLGWGWGVIFVTKTRKGETKNCQTFTTNMYEIIQSLKSLVSRIAIVLYQMHHTAF